MRAEFTFCDVPQGLPEDAIVIKDTGHEHGVSVTNDAEAVVKFILRALPDAAKTRIFYYDSDDCLDELCHDGTHFTKFAPGPKIEGTSSCR